MVDTDNWKIHKHLLANVRLSFSHFFLGKVLFICSDAKNVPVLVFPVYFDDFHAPLVINEHITSLPRVRAKYKAWVSLKVCYISKHHDCFPLDKVEGRCSIWGLAGPLKKCSWGVVEHMYGDTPSMCVFPFPLVPFPRKHTCKECFLFHEFPLVWSGH